MNAPAASKGFAMRMSLLFRAFTGALLAACATLAPAQSLPGKNFLWEVSSLTNRVYLYGTIHAGKAEWFPLPAAVENALADSKVVVVEADVTNTDAMAKSSTLMIYAPPDTLDKHVPPEDYARFSKIVAKYKIPESAVGQMKPFMAVSLLVFSEWGRLGYLPQHGIDSYVIRKARAETKPLIEIEGLEAQMALMDSLTEEENRAVFAGTLTAIESGMTSEQITGMVNAWQSGDPDLLLEVARKYNTEIKGASNFEEKFVWSRHDAMLRKIEGYLDQTRSRHFIAVGALHLAGERGLVQLLRKRGYVVKQL
jgi:uncharacterized protein YbaP (TraB family)